MPWAVSCAPSRSPNPLAMAAGGVTLAQLSEAIRATNRATTVPDAWVEGAMKYYLVRSEGSITSLDDLRAVVVTVQTGRRYAWAHLADRHRLADTLRRHPERHEAVQDCAGSCRRQCAASG